jgi:hypothetical protein
MAITIGNTSVGTGASAASLSHNNDGDVVIACLNWSANDDTPGAPTYGGQAMTLAVGAAQSWTAARIYYLENAPSGVNTFVSSGFTHSQSGTQLISLSGAAAPTDMNTNTVTGTSSTCAVTLPEGGIAIDSLNYNAQTTGTQGANQTVITNSALGSNQSSYNTTNGTMSWTGFSGGSNEITHVSAAFDVAPESTSGASDAQKTTIATSQSFSNKISQ